MDVQADEFPGRANAEDVVVVNRGRRTRAVAHFRGVLVECAVRMRPALSARGAIVADDGLLAVALFEGDGDVPRHGDTTVTAGARMLPQHFRWLLCPVGLQPC